MQVIEVRDLMLRHKDVVLDVNIGKLSDALKKLIDAIGAEGENLAFLAKDNYFTREQHIVITDADGVTLHQMTIQPDLIYSNDALYFDVPSLHRTPLPENPSDDEIVTWKEVTDLRQELYDRTQYATEERTGVVRLATQEETDAFENDYAVVTPKKLSTLNDRVITLEKKRVYILNDVLPDSLLDNTIYVVTDKEEYIYCRFNGVEGVPSIQIVYIQRGSTWAEIKDQVQNAFKPGSTFMYWTINGIPVSDDYVFNIEDVTAYAQFADAVNVITFIAYEGNPEEQELIVAEGATWAEIKDQVTVPIRTGYGFLEWQVDGITLTDEYVFTNPKVITAIWDSATIPLIFDAQGGIPRTQQIYVAKGARWDSVKKLIQAPAKDNTLFLRWTIDGVSRIAEDYRFNFETKIFALYGVATEIQIDVQGGVPEQNAVVVPKGSSWYEVKHKFVTPFKEGFTFFHWLLNECEVTDDTFFFEDCKIVAYYEELLQIDFRGDGALPDLQTIKVDKFSTWAFNKNRIAVPELSGEAFIGWVERKQVFLDVYFDAYKGEPSQQVLEVRRMTTWQELRQRATEPSKPNYTFKEWCFAQTLNSIDENYAIEKDEHLRATYTYILNVEAPEQIIVDEDTLWKDIVDLIPIPTKEDFHFTKWQIANEDIAEDRVITPLDRIEPVFERNVLIVTIDTNQGESTQNEVEVGQGLTWADEKHKFLNPTRKYYNFVDWSLDGVSPIADEYVIEGSFTIIALWERIQIMLTFNAKNSTPLTQSVTVGAGSTWKEFKEQIQDPVQTGMYFMYWVGEHGEVNDQYLFEYSQTLNAYYRLAIQLNFDGDIGDPQMQEVISYQGTNFKNVKRYLVDASTSDQKFIGWGQKAKNCCYPIFTSSIGLPSSQSIEVLKNRTFGEIKEFVQIPVERYYTFYNWITPDNRVLTDDYRHIKTEEFRANITRNQTTITVDDGTKKYEIVVNEGSTWGEIKHLFVEPVLEDYAFSHWALSGKILVDGDIIEGSNVEIEACFNLTEPSIIIKHPDGSSSRFDFDFGQTWGDIKDLVPVPPKKYFSLDHWEMNGALIDDQYELKPGDVIVPIYNRNIIQISLNLDGGTSSQSVVEVGQGLTWLDEKAKFLTPLKEFFTFRYWMCNGHEVQDSFVFEVSTTFTAIYERNKSTLTVMSDGQLFKEIQIDDGLTFAEIETRISEPTKVDYKFTHWSLTDNGAAIPEDQIISGDTIIYAVFAYNVCNLVFDVQEGTPEIESFKVFKGTTFGDAKKRIPLVTRYGYLLVGWSFTTNGDIIDDDAVLQDDFINLFAVWNNLIYVTFDVENGGVQTQVVATVVNAKLSEIIDQVIEPNKEDYRFIGWAQNAGGLPIEDMVFIGDTRLYAIFAYDVVNINFDTGDGTKIDPIKVPKGTIFEDIVESIEKPISELEGNFKHWSLTKGGNAIDPSLQLMSDNMTLYAVYWGNVAIIFDVNGGTPNIDPLFVPYSTTMEEVQEMITMPTKQGHFFAGWELNYNPSNTVIVFNTAGGTPIPETVSVTDGTLWKDFVKTVQAPAKGGHTFQYWSLTMGGAPIPDEYTIDGEIITVYAVFTINQTRIVFETFGGTPVPEPLIVDYGTTWENIKNSVDAPAKENHAFNHWSLKENGEVIEDIQIFTTSEVTIYAVYDITHVVLNFDTQGGTEQSSLTVQYRETWGNVKGQLTAPTKTGYTFQYWSLNAQGEAIRDDYEFIAGSNRIYAIYKINSFIITFNVFGGVPEQDPMTVDYGTTWGMLRTQLTNPVKEGHTFHHWSLAESGTEINEQFVFVDAQTVYAVYSVNSITISIDTQGGVPEQDPMTVDYGTTWAQIKDLVQNPSIVGHHLLHFSAIAGGAAISNDFVFTGNMTIYAVFEANVLTLTINGSSMQTAITVPYGTTWATAKQQLQDPIKEGHTFDWWSLQENGVNITDEFVFTTDLNIYAVYTIESYDIVIVGSNQQDAIIVEYGTTWAEFKKLLIEPTNDHGVFKHWSLEEKGDPVPDTHIFTTYGYVYAVFDMQQVLLTFVLDGGTPDPGTLSVDYGTTWSKILTSLQVPTKEGAIFSHWSDTEDGDVLLSTTIITQPMTIYAVYEYDSVTITFDANGGEPQPDEIIVDYGTTWAEIKDQVTAPVKSGYTFLGWEVVE